MPTSTICYGAIIPPSRFRWICKESSGQWSLREPPDDWPEVDYKAFDSYIDPNPDPKIINRFHLAASVTECLKTHKAAKSEFGQMINEPDLYLKFASTRPTPSAILGMANTYGLLRYPIHSRTRESLVEISRANAPDIAAAFPHDPRDIGSQKDTILLFVEPAENWLGKYDLINLEIRTWAELQANEDVEGMWGYLEDGFNYDMGGSLTYQAKIDRATGQTYSEIIASSLYSLLDVQWGMSVAANTLHKPCEECTKWMPIGPGAGRPEKTYCSDACRMRAYRSRKSMTESKGSLPSSGKNSD